MFTPTNVDLTRRMCRRVVSATRSLTERRLLAATDERAVDCGVSVLGWRRTSGNRFLPVLRSFLFFALMFRYCNAKGVVVTDEPMRNSRRV